MTAKPKRRDMLPFWTDAYLADTNMLTCKQHGAYMLLIITCWRTTDCRLPNDDRKLARCAQLSLKEWNQLKGDVLPYWSKTACGNWITQKKLTELFTKDKDYKSKKSDAGKTAGTPERKPSSRVDDFPQGETAPPQVIENIEYEVNTAVAVAVAVERDYTALGARELLDLCIEAARPCLKETSIPMLPWRPIERWMTGENAVIFEDVLAGIQSVVARSKKLKQITTWKYFEGSVFDERDSRLIPNPKPNLGATNGKRSSNSASKKNSDIGERRRAVSLSVLEERKINRMATEI